MDSLEIQTCNPIEYMGHDTKKSVFGEFLQSEI